LGSIIYFKRGGNMGMFFIATEISTIPLNLRWFLVHSDYKKSLLLIPVNFVFLFSFFIVRIYGLPWFINCLIQLNYTDSVREMKIMALLTGTIISGLNVYWFVLMIEKVIGMLFPGKTATKEYYSKPVGVDKQD